MSLLKTPRTPGELYEPVSSKALQDEFFQSLVWKDVIGILDEQIEHDRDTLETASDLNHIIELQASIGERRLMLDMPAILAQRTKQTKENA